MIQLRLPNISGSEREMVAQIRSYLYQIVPELEFAINNVSGTLTTVVESPTPKSLLPTDVVNNASPQATFNAIKSLIIKSADIVDAYYQEINRKLDGAYVAVSDFGEFAEKTSQAIEETSTSTTQGFENVQVLIMDNSDRIAEVDGDLQDSKEVINNTIQGVQDNVSIVNAAFEDTKVELQGSLEALQVYLTELQETIIGVTAYLKTGLLYHTDGGIPVYGLEIGQTVRDDTAGEAVFHKYARFTSEKLSFYDSNGSEVAYISDKKLYIRFAEITISQKIGGFVDTVKPNGDVVTKWVGG